MANQEHWNVANEREMWLKVVGKEQEDRTETILQADKIFKDIPVGLACVEIGAGVGRFAKFAICRFNAYHGFDISSSIVNIAPEVYEHSPRVTSAALYINDGVSFWIPDGKVDFVFSFTCFQHMPTMEMVRANLNEACRVLRPGGLCRIQTVKGNPEDKGRYDGIVFRNAESFALEFMRAGFDSFQPIEEGEWIWITAKK